MNIIPDIRNKGHLLKAVAILTLAIGILFVLHIAYEVRKARQFLSVLVTARPGITTEVQFQHNLHHLGKTIRNGATWDNGESGDGIRFQSATPFRQKGMFLGAAIFRNGVLVKKTVRFGKDSCCLVVVDQSSEHDNPELQSSSKIYRESSSDRIVKFYLGNNVSDADIGKAFSLQMDCLYFWHQCRNLNDLMPNVQSLSTP